MVDEPPAPEDAPTEDVEEEVERDDDKLSSTMESPIDAADKATEANGDDEDAQRNSTPPDRPKSIPPRPKSERPPAPLPSQGKPPLSAGAKSAPPKPPSRAPKSQTSSSKPPPKHESVTPDGVDLDGPTTEMTADEVDAALESPPDDSNNSSTGAVQEVDPADFAKTLRIERRVPRGMMGSSGAPPGIPSLAQQEDDGEKKKSGSKRRKSRKGKRRTVKIPDDNVPATPTPPAIASSSEDAEPEATAPESDEFDSRQTMVMEPPSEAASAKSAPPATASDDEATEENDSDDENDSGEGADGDDSADDDSAPEIEPEDDDSDAEEEDAEASERTSGVFTDERSIAVVRPIEVINQLPPVESAGESSGQPSARRPPPPRRSERPGKQGSTEEIEEIIPDRMSLPTAASDSAAIVTDGDSGTKSARRPLPPPRSAMASDPSLLLETPIEIGATHATGLDAMTGLSEAASAAELAAREAEEVARKAEARAREAQARAEQKKKQAKRPKKPWWMEWFHGDFLSTMDNPKKKDVARETTFIEESLRLEPGARVLDLCCGHGVHAVELASRGFQLVGVDVSQDMLAFANEYNTKRNTAVSFIQGDMRELNLDGVFDGIYCWSSSFGYFDEQRNIDVLERVARALRPGGRFALDVTNRDYVAVRSPSMAWFDKPGCVCMDEMKFDFYTSRMITKRMVMFDTGKSKEMESSIRLYTLHEMGRLLHKVGFKVLEVSGHRAHRGAYFGVESPRMIIVSERRENEA
jgi:ubiquinone/menaquinone biosynthesis C-methylase UbiE